MALLKGFDNFGDSTITNDVGVLNFFDIIT